MEKNVPKMILFFSAAWMFVFAAAASCSAGAWTRKPGEAYHQLTVGGYFADEHFDNDADRRGLPADGDFMDINANYYLEYGILDRLTVMTSLYYKYLAFEDDAVESKTYGMPDMDLGARYRLSDAAWGIFSFQGLVKIPETYDEDDGVPLGNGQYDLEARLLYGKSLYPAFPGYANLELAYRWRMESPSDELRYLAEFGMDFTQKYYGRVKLDGIFSIENGDARAAVGNNPRIANEFDLGKLDLVFGCTLSPGWAVELGVRPEIYGRNTSAGTNVFLALAFKR